MSNGSNGSQSDSDNETKHSTGNAHAEDEISFASTSPSSSNGRKPLPSSRSPTTSASSTPLLASQLTPASSGALPHGPVYAQQDTSSASISPKSDSNIQTASPTSVPTSTTTPSTVRRHPDEPTPAEYAIVCKPGFKREVERLFRQEMYDPERPSPLDRFPNWVRYKTSQYHDLVSSTSLPIPRQIY